MNVELCLDETRERGEVNLLFNVTIYDISVIYVTAHRYAGGLKKLYLRSGSQRHRHFVGFFNVPVQAPTRGQPFYTVIPRNRPIESPFTITLGIRRTHSRLNPPPPPRALMGDSRTKKNLLQFREQIISDRNLKGKEAQKRQQKEGFPINRACSHTEIGVEVLISSPVRTPGV